MSNIRIENIVGLVERCGTFMDVGCDHGIASKRVLELGLCDRVVAVDISEKCLMKARILLKGYKNVEFVCSDGIPQISEINSDGNSKLNYKPDFILIAGMGGHTVRDILLKYNGDAKLLISPQSHPEIVRAHLINSDYVVTYDNCFLGGSKYYDLIKAQKIGTYEISGNIPCDYLDGGKPDELWLKYGNYKVKNEALKGRLQRILMKVPKGSAKHSELMEVMKWQK